MGLLSIIRKQKLKEKELRILMLGLDNAGKSTIVKAILGQDIFSVSPTLGFSIQTVEYEGYKLNIWDIGGQESLRPFWRNYFEKTDALVWVLDAMDLERLDTCKAELDKVLGEDRLLGMSVLIFINKIDCVPIEDRQSLVNIVKDRLQLEDYPGHEFNIIPCSAHENLNLDIGLEWIVQEIRSKLYKFD